jgi:hypothetical protein
VADAPVEPLVAAATPDSPIDRPVARVFGRPVSGRDALAARQRAPEGTTLAEAAVLAAGRLLAADEAERVRFPRKEGEGREEYVDRFLAATFSPETSCLGVDEQDVASTAKRLTKRFDHPDVYKVLDLQIVCCPKDEAPCLDDALAAACFVESASAIEQARAAVAPAKTEAEVRRAAETAARSIPRLAIVPYTFAYDHDRPHADQGGPWAVMDPAIVQVVRGLEAGALSEPVRSAYGYHVLYVRDHQSPDRRGPDDPSVRKEVFDLLCEGILKRARVRYVVDLASSAGTEVSREAVEALQALEPEGSGTTGD